MRPDSAPYSQMRRVVRRLSAVSYWARTSQWSRTGGPSAEPGSPIRERTVAASAVRQPLAAQPRPSRADGAARTPPAAAPASRARSAGIAPNSRTRAASPGAWASTMRAAVSSHSPYPACSAAARPPRSRSASRCSSSVAPAVIRSARRSARRRAASGSARRAPDRARPSPVFVLRALSAPCQPLLGPVRRLPRRGTAPLVRPPRAAAAPARACTGTSGSDNCTCTRAPWSPRRR